MKFSIKQPIFLKYLSLLGRANLSPSVNIKFLGYLFCSISSNLKYLKIISINLEMEFSIKITELEIYKPGKCIFFGKKIYEICKNMPKNSLITVELQNNKIFINCSNNTKFILNSCNLDMPPQISTFFNKYDKKYFNLHVSFHQDLFYQLLVNTYFSMPNTHEIKYNGMFIEITRDLLSAVTLDGQRLSKCDVFTIRPLNLDRFSFIISKRTVLELIRIFNLKSENREIHFSVIESFLKVDIEDMSIISKLIPLTAFPNYSKILEDIKNYNKFFFIEKKILKESCLRIAALNTEKKDRQITFIMFNNTLKIISNNKHNEEAQETLSIKYEKALIKISFHVDYLIDALNAITTEEVKILFKDKFSSLRLKNSCIDNCLYIIMPLNL